jgi:hypothetical protein
MTAEYGEDDAIGDRRRIRREQAGDACQSPGLRSMHWPITPAGLLPENLPQSREHASGSHDDEDFQYQQRPPGANLQNEGMGQETGNAVSGDKRLQREQRRT